MLLLRVTGSGVMGLHGDMNHGQLENQIMMVDMVKIMVQSIILLLECGMMKIQINLSSVNMTFVSL